MVKKQTEKPEEVKQELEEDKVPEAEKVEVKDDNLGIEQEAKQPDEEMDAKADKRKAYPNSSTVEEVSEEKGIIFFKAKKKLTDTEHKNLSKKIRQEMKETGLEIVLVPFSVEHEISAE
ncbi:hypothetical protein ACM26V_00420 [Salipaludibacillus sp. HK11]|uniref:hypothetical protein n=1 Tax=Salipaludibacillus sp. HK11 TaxID=3394320 RepID=UPI0039FD37A9